MATDLFEMLPFAPSSVALVGLPATVALAAVALIGYVFGTRTRDKQNATLDNRRRLELERAVRIAWHLEKITETLRHELVTHHSQVVAFKRRLRQTKGLGTDAAWEKLFAEAEAMLAPTMQLAHQLSHAYDQIRQQSDALETFTHGRTDPLTGVGNARALDQQLRVLLTAASHGIGEFNIALVSLDHEVTKADGLPPTSALPMLPKLAAVIRTCMRDTDFVARYGDEEFVIVMAHTTAAGAAIFAERLQRHVVEDLGTSVCCGLAESQAGDDSRSLFARADSALYSAKAAGSNRLFAYAGGHIREHLAGAAVLPTAGAREFQAPAESHPARKELSA